MKLYVKASNRHEYISEFTSQKDLDKYIGTDRWVKILYNDIYEHYWWIKIIKKTPEGFLANGFYDFMINHPTGVSLEERHLDFETVFEYKKIRVPNPIEAITTEYIYNNYLNK